jgi:PAS domain S-box-containing protein
MDSGEVKILYVEDNLADRLYFQHESEKAGFPFKADIAVSLKEAVAFLKQNRYQAVVSDYYLRDGQAIDLFPFLDESPLIIITCEGSEDMALHALKTGAYDYLIKDDQYNYMAILPLSVTKTIEQKKQRDELNLYRTELEKLVEERTNELIILFEKVQESETNFRNIFDNTSDGIIITDHEFNFLEANNTLLHGFGITKEFLATHSLIDFLSPAYRELIFDRLQLLKLGVPSGNLEIEIISPLTGQIVPMEINNVPIIFNQKNAILTVMRDITERKTIARKLFETIIKTEEEERTRIAKNLHDEIGPVLSALKIYLTSFVDNPNVDKKIEMAGQISMIIRDMIESVRNISNDMSPHILVNFGLIAAIRSISDLFSRNIAIHLHTNFDQTRFPDIVESVIYRVIKELINNTVKHAHASDIFIRVDYNGHILECNYKDNGIGFNMNEYNTQTSKGMGITNIRSRIHSLGGRLHMVTSPGNGFEISFFMETVTAQDD